MKHRLKHWAQSLPLDSTLKRIAVSAWVLDVLSCFYMVKWWQAKNLGERVLQKTLMVNGIDEFPAELRSEVLGMTEMLFAGLILALILTNSIFYAGYGYRKRWAAPYVTAYLVGAAIFGIFMLLEGFPVGGAWELVNILGTPAYFVLGFIAWARKPELMVKK
jgi:hypothetical protein